MRSFKATSISTYLMTVFSVFLLRLLFCFLLIIFDPRNIFSIEQQEYDKEGINWAKIEFKDNQDVLDLIEKVGDN